MAAQLLPGVAGGVTIYLGITEFPPTSDIKLVYCGRVSEAFGQAVSSVTSECIIPVNPKFIYITAENTSTGPLVLCNISIAVFGKFSQKLIITIYTENTTVSSLVKSQHICICITVGSVGKYQSCQCITSFLEIELASQKA